MKYISSERKRYLITYSTRKHRHELQRKEIRKQLKYKNLLKKIQARKVGKFISDTNSVKHETCLAPSIFSFTQDPDTAISYFQKSRKALDGNLPVFFDLTQVTYMGPETLTYLCAFVKEDKIIKNNVVKGNVPNDPIIKQMFKKSGFYDLMSSGFSSNNESKDVDNKLIYKKTQERVESTLAGDVCKSAMEHTFGTSDPKHQRFYRILIECMGNTWNHANYADRSETYSWWLLAYKEPSTKITKFCFLDLGIGIFGSLEYKYKEHKLNELLKWFKPNKNKETLGKIFKGQRRTSTKELAGRGQGLNYIYSLVKKDKTIKNFTLISNDIIARIGYNADDKIDKIKNGFIGTLYYWEIIPNHD